VENTELATFEGQLDRFRAQVRRSTAINVNGATERDAAQALLQEWFRITRPALLSVGLAEEPLFEIDTEMQDLLRLAGGRNRRASYMAILDDAWRAVRPLAILQEKAISEGKTQSQTPSVSPLEERMLDTLSVLVPSAGLSYQQAILDLADQSRLSFRGPANELRSALWDVLDRLAPDSDVMSAPGFKLEEHRKKPTQKQKARFILRSRQIPENARRAPETTVALVEEIVSTLTRAVYDRSSISAHIAATREEVHQVKMYVDTVLAELLEIHAV
jgi:hypothetical protein